MNCMRPTYIHYIIEKRMELPAQKYIILCLYTFDKIFVYGSVVSAENHKFRPEQTESFHFQIIHLKRIIFIFSHFWFQLAIIIIQPYFLKSFVNAFCQASYAFYVCHTLLCYIRYTIVLSLWNVKNQIQLY